MIRRGKKGKYVIRSESGLLEDAVWKAYLKDYPIELVSRIRNELKDHIYGLAEKLNRNSRYFGYRVGKSADKVYIYVQKEKLRIDLCIGREHEEEIRTAGFDIVYVDNFQGRAGWLTGWQIPQSTLNLKPVMKWLYRAFLRGNR